MNTQIDIYRVNRWLTKSKHYSYKALVGDRRCVFYDLSKVKASDRIAKSPVLQFYSSIENIGNFLPILGIQKMIGQITDTWCIHDANIDFDFINDNYKCIIIGGAGLLVQDGNDKFERFWRNFLNNCKLPTIIWGVGADDVWKISDSYREVVFEVAKKCDLINVRDSLTAETFNLPNAHISPCPTIVYVQKFVEEDRNLDGNRVTFVRNPSQLYNETIIEMDKVIRNHASVVSTTNHQYSFIGLDDIIRKYYLGSDFIVTTMLHASIISYGLGIPYVSVTKTQKITEFQQRFQNGLSIKTPQELEEVFASNAVSGLKLKPIEIESVLEFGNQACQWIKAVCVSTGT